MLKKILITVVSLAAVIGVLVGVKALQFKKMGDMAAMMEPPPETVATAIVEQTRWQRAIKAIGSVEPVQGVMLRAEEDGPVREILFENGQAVAAGELLLQQDVDNERARLRSAKARVQLAQSEFERANTLRESGSIPQAQLDAAVAEYERAQAEIEEIEATISNKAIKAPFSGMLGIRQVNLGQFVSRGDPIVELQDNARVYINLNLPQRHLSEVDPGMQVVLTTSSFPDRTFTGAITAISPTVDPVTRSFELQATVDNPERQLRSGLFVRVEVQLPGADEVNIVPLTAVLSAPYGDSVYVIQRETDASSGEEQLSVRQRIVRLGERRGDFVAVTDGLEAGDEVVSAGAFKLRNGSAVTINNDLTSDPQLAPTPDNS